MTPGSQSHLHLYACLVRSDVQYLLESICLADFMSHCIGAFNKRCKEMNLPECRLALFLDPRYKAAADAPGKFAEMVLLVRSP